ncbi:hypothetical protein [Sandarakinorhabdus sp.]|uniref:hypothetical protein n=1 Tax=Sandarakinorhabdus sp. TaxID=1916663 RepID=UPI00286E4C6A|nr:hypothetical protein [Sandarakinorhabdus sp.]
MSIILFLIRSGVIAQPSKPGCYTPTCQAATFHNVNALAKLFHIRCFKANAVSHRRRDRGIGASCWPDLGQTSTVSAAWLAQTD